MITKLRWLSFLRFGGQVSLRKRDFIDQCMLGWFLGSLLRLFLYLFYFGLGFFVKLEFCVGTGEPLLKIAN